MKLYELYENRDIEYYLHIYRINCNYTYITFTCQLLVKLIFFSGEQEIVALWDIFTCCQGHVCISKAH